MITAANLTPLARMLTAHMLNSMVEGFAIAGFTWILLRVLGRRNSSTRFAVWFAALVAIAALPFAGSASSAGGGATHGAAPAFAVPVAWAPNIFAMWILVAVVALARVAIGLWRLRALRANCIPVDLASLDPALREILQGAKGFRTVTLCLSTAVRVPAAIGYFKPLIVLPDWVVQELSDDELNSVVMHELAHLRRWDDWTNLAQKVVKALLFFHPAVWWIESKISLEREMACDDAVLSAAANPRDYARCLVTITEKSFVRRGVLLAQAAVNRVHQTSLRVAQILDVNRSPVTKVWKPALYSVAAFSLACLVAPIRTPQLVAFEDQPTKLAAAFVPTARAIPAVSEHIAKSASITPAVAKSQARNTRVALGSARSTTAKKIDSAHLPSADEARFVPMNPADLNDLASVPIAGGPARTLFVVMRSDEYGQAGSMMWHVLVWRVTVVTPGDDPIGLRASAKKI
jgi:beta-lactamase regulating signal transducer with metallopeptidase domain